MLGSIFEDAHAKRVDSLANYAVGAMTAARAGIRAIGAAYAAIAEIQPKSGVKQVDRYLSNDGIDVEALTPAWVKFVLGPREAVRIAVDWTEFDDDKHATLAAYVITTHGRATPLAWKTVDKSTLRNRRTGYEQGFIERLARAIPPEVEIELLADRGFGDQKLYQLLDMLGWDYTIRFRSNILVEHEGVANKAKEWVPASGRATKLVGAKVTGKRIPVAAVVVVHNKKMKEPWCLVTSRGTATASSTVKRYGRRFTIEETFRDQKDPRFGMGLRATRIGSAQRRDRLLMLLAIAQALLTLLGAAAERAGLDRYHKTNTSKKRTHSLFRQGCDWYSAIPYQRADWIDALISAFEEVLQEHQTMAGTLAVI
jgi:hypothetical protein